VAGLNQEDYSDQTSADDERINGVENHEPRPCRLYSVIFRKVVARAARATVNRSGTHLAHWQRYQPGQETRRQVPVMTGEHNGAAFLLRKKFSVFP